uniref:Pathogenesis-related (PR)-10-related norcoclaurine synthase-like protein n=1 Tax=Eschscholzia californica TaxID=3467 RepID=C3SBS5_ESCCA|nr:pathogenesis-related (PR)-10-related norcoclaurine synthase-like protein [Eschscholzia californica]
MRGHVTNEMDVVGASADEIWAIYGSHDLPRLIIDLQPGVFERIDILEGDGGEGTILHIVMAQGIPGPREWKEKFVKLDDQERVKVIQQIEGGYLDLGFSLHQDTFEILPIDNNSCIIRSTVTIDLDNQFESNASLITVDSLWGMAKSIVKYVLDNKSKKEGKEEPTSLYHGEQHLALDDCEACI